MIVGPIWRAFLQGAFVGGGLMMIGFAAGIGLEKLAKFDPTFPANGIWFGRAGMLMLALWLPLLWLLDRLERRSDKQDQPGNAPR
jgi:hypothetical protein